MEKDLRAKAQEVLSGKMTILSTSSSVNHAKLSKRLAGDMDPGQDTLLRTAQLSVRC